VDVSLRKPKNNKGADKKQLKFPFMDLVPGWEGWKWLLCSDDHWHLVSAIRTGLAADAQCSGNVTVIQQTNPNNHPMCRECCDIQAAKWDKGPYAAGR
jgi:hypothetical protein